MKTRSFPFCFAVILWALIMTAPAWATEKVVVVTDYWAPFWINGKDGLTGLDKDLMEEVGRRMGIEFTFFREPWARCLLDMETGEADIVTAVAITPERAKFMLFSDAPYFTCAPAFYERKGRKGPPINTYEDLYKFTVGHTRDSVYFDRFDSDDKLHKVACDNEAQLIAMTQAAHMKVFIGTDCQVDYDLARLQLTDIIKKTPYRPEKRIGLHIAVSKKSPFRERIDELNAVLRQLSEDGTIFELRSQYFTSVDGEQSTQ